MSVRETTNRITGAIANLSNRYAPAVITIIVLGCFFYYYFSVIVSTNETELKERKFRGLHQVAAAMKSKLETYEEKNAKNFIERLKVAKKPKDVALTEKEFGLKLHKHKAAPVNTKTHDYRPDADSQEHHEKFKYDSIEKQFEFCPEQITCAAVQLDTFLNPLLRRDLFDKYLLAESGVILEDELNISHKSLNDYLSTSIQDDTTAGGQVKKAGNLIKTNIGGKDYRLFTIGFSAAGKNNFTIGGYITDDEYEAERKYIPTYGILCLVIGVVCVIVLIPLLKVFLMHRSEQLVTMTVSSAFAAIHLLASILVLSILTFYVNYRVASEQKDNVLQTIAQDIDHTLNEEIAAYRRVLTVATDDVKALDMADNSKDTLSRLYDVFIWREGARRLDTDTTTTAMEINSYDSIRALVTQVQWTDITGQQRIRWTKDKLIPYKTNIEDRDYFKAVMDKKMFYDTANQPYFFTDISSWVSNRNFAIVSMPVEIEIRDDPGRPLKVVSGGGRLRSVFTSILPFGYSYCVIDPTGKVFFHKDDSRNLNENLLQELGDRQSISSIIVERTAEFFDAKYSGSNHRFFCMPIKGTPYSILTFRDLQLGWAEELDIISATSILVLCNLGVLLFAILAIRALSYSDGKTKTRSLAFTWLRPVRSLKREYISVTAFFGISMLMQLIFIYWLRNIDNLTLVMGTFTYTYLMLVATFHLFSIHKDPHRHIFERPKKILFFLLIIPLICIFFYGRRYGLVALWLLAEIAAFVLIYLLLTYKWKRIAAVARTMLEETKTTWLKPGFRHAYTWFVWTLIISGSVVPLIIFYVLCFDEQSKMSNRYAQWDFANQLTVSPNKPFQNLAGPITTSYLQPYHYSSIASEISGYTAKRDTVTEADPFTAFYKLIKPSFLNYNLNLELLTSQAEADAEFSWQRTGANKETALYFRQNPASVKTGFIGWKLSEPRDAQARDHLRGLINVRNILLLGLILSLLYFLLNRLIRKIFFDGAMEPAFPVALDLLNGQSAGVDGNLFIYGPPGTHKIKAVKKEILKHGSFVHIDLGELAHQSPELIISEKSAALAALPKYTTILLLTNISAEADSAVATAQKLSIIEHFQRQKQKMIIISSKYYESLAMFEYETGNGAKVSYRSRWDNLMQTFYNVYHHWPKKQPDGLLYRKEEQISQFLMNSYGILGRQVPVSITTNKTVFPLRDGIHQHIIDEIQRLINQVKDECSHSAFLNELTEPMIAYASRIASPPARNIENYSPWPANRIISRHFLLVFSKVCDRIESLATNHYMSIWKAITPEEQKTLYDIALDELVNPFNRKTAIRLCEIGLIKPIDGLACYTIMNNSFRSYILNHVANFEITGFRKEIASKGFGSSVQLPLIIVAIGALAFIAFTQREAFTSFISYLGAGFAGITTLLKVISSIPDSKPAVKT